MPGCPKESRFGNNTIVQAALLKYEDRLPHRKIQNAMMWATILDLTRRAADAVQSEYDRILERVRNASILHVDETSIKVPGKKYWIWVFTTPAETFIAIRHSRGTKVLMEILTRKFKGIIVCDGWKPYSKFTKHIRAYVRAHLLRESKDLTDKITEAVPLHQALTRLYRKLTNTLRL
ncbi:MAG: hypothetical protein EF813_03705 [Methanosarcinales archaeon]|nr:MAG: hypothetical protein EF813_03705 [Methanosarcinales archaeon]